MNNAVEFHGISRRFGGVTAVDDVSFSIAAGETVALLGPSGCGKTTILRVIAGFERPDAGTVSIGGRDVTALKPYERNVGLLFQHYALFPHMTVAENIAYGLRHRGADKREIPDRVEAMLALVRLQGFGARRPHQLSGGQQQRVALARALATRPSLILLDEPLSALDAKLRQDLRAELKQVLAAVNSTAMVVTHDQEEAMSLGERVFLMQSGRIVQVGTPSDVYGRPDSRFAADFMGRTNWIEAQVTRRETGFARATSRSGLSLMVPDCASDTIDICVRPENIVLSAADAADPDGMANSAKGRILNVALLGATRQILVEMPGGQQLLVMQANRVGDGLDPGKAVRIGFPVAACITMPASNPAGSNQAAPNASI
ncbi:ABC transporter ATP-binding protein [Bosea sp. LjRoot9]|uniref:ABC transporter ATP-binding protein n=1 Tax=Bosea sp. LjRoot9 TaxID=3342341 RepID=UPI003ECE987B